MEELSIDTRTPIEIALDIDSEGMTTAKKLYAFLELNPANFSHWCRRNIIENEFAAENEDYVRFVFDDETPTGGKVQREDFRLTAHFAKKLCVKGNGARSEEAREYFTTIEERVKQKAIDYNQLSPNLQMARSLLQSQIEMELAQKRQAEQIAKLEESTQAIKDAVTPPSDNWREDIIKNVHKIQKASNIDYKSLNTEMYSLLERRAGCDLGTRLRNKQNRMRECGCTKTQINNLRKIDIIDEDKKLREIYDKIVSEYMIHYCA